MKLEEIKCRDSEYVIPTYGERAAAFIRGKGVFLWDTEGKKYLDFVAGLSVNSLGYSHPEIVKAIARQARQLIHISNLYYHQAQGLLAEKLVKLSFPGKCFFANSGLEANEAAIKLCRKYGLENLNGAYEIITMEKSFHGRSLATLAATGQEKIHKGFYPLMPGFHYAKLNDINSVKEKITPLTCAVMLEPVQGEGGIYVSKKGFLKELRALCSEKKILLIFDEVQCGLGRTGKFFAFEHFGVKPDVLTLAKAVASGLPMGVMMASLAYSHILGKGNHASTFGGNPLACAASLKTIDLISRQRFLEEVAGKGDYFKNFLEKLKTKFSFIKEVRGLGLMLGLEVDSRAPQIAKMALPEGLIINAVGDNILRFLPPLVITRTEINRGLKILEKVLKTI